MQGLEGPLQKVWDLAEPLAHTMGLELVWVEIASPSGRRTLRLTIDYPEEARSVTVDECAAFSRALDPILDVESEMTGRYQLEVSSPGLNRPLVRAEHFPPQVGSILEVSSEDAVEGRRHFKGLLKDADITEGGEIVIEVDGHNFHLPYSKIKKAHLDYFATEALKDNQKIKRIRYAPKKKKDR